MVLGFKKHFVEPILKGTKIHSIRAGERWKPEMKIHMATGVRTKNYHCFKEAICKGVQKIEILWDTDVHFAISGSTLMANDRRDFFKVIIDGKQQSVDKGNIESLAFYDGLKDGVTFLQWPSWYLKNFTGQIIHWTDIIRY